MSVALDDFSTLVGQIYEASLDVSVWPQTLDAVCRFVGAPMGGDPAYAALWKSSPGLVALMDRRRAAQAAASAGR
jgi:hypothetical protein